MNLWWQRTTYSYWESIMVHWSDEEEMKEMFYLMMHSTHFLMVICQTHEYSFRLAVKVFLYASSHREDNTYHSFVTPVVEHWLEWEIDQWVWNKKDKVQLKVKTEFYKYMNHWWHSTTYSYWESIMVHWSDEEGNVLFNDALTTFYLWLCVGHMVKDHSDSERGNLQLPLHGLHFLISSKESLTCIIPHNTYHGLCYTSHGALAFICTIPQTG